MTTFVPSSNHSMWIGYQVVAAIGLRLGVQQYVLFIPLQATTHCFEICQNKRYSHL